MQGKNIKTGVIICTVFFCTAVLSSTAASNIVSSAASTAEAVVFPTETETSSAALNAAANTVSVQQAGTSTFQSSPVTISPYYDIDGSKYYRVHIVEKGHTLYSIARAYKCAITDIIKNSPQGDNTISIGEPLRIPLFDKTQISSLKRYNVKDTLAKRAEQELPQQAQQARYAQEQSQALQQKQPPPAQQAEQQIEQPALQQDQRQGRRQQREQERKKEQQQEQQEYQQDQPLQPQEPQHYPIQMQEPKDIINISLMLPLYAEDTSFPKKQFYFLPILQGTMLAMEEIDKNSTPKINVNVFDLTENISSWNAVKNNSKFLESDIILCAAYKNIFPRLDTFSRQNNIPLVHLHSERDSMCLGNPYFIQLLPSQSTQIEIFADTVISRFSRSNFIIFVEDITTADRFQAAQYLYNLLEKAKNEKRFNPQKIHLYDPNEAGYAKFSTLLDNKNSNVVCGFTRQEIQLANMFVPLLKNSASKAEDGMPLNNYDISLFGPATWAYFSKVDPELFYRTSFTYFNTFATKLDPYESKSFEKKFYDRYGTLPDGMAYKGYMF
ncbi:MAG: LysM peptidoglycan-binding domain-containing protein, partial [Bacteroidales bacterium]|nr:LysM peptidoglycan-binding domain-containing protein [Bacteroidales bacterium]